MEYPRRTHPESSSHVRKEKDHDFVYVSIYLPKEFIFVHYSLLTQGLWTLI